jgi:hypothetical protein
MDFLLNSISRKFLLKDLIFIHTSCYIYQIYNILHNILFTIFVYIWGFLGLVVRDLK